MEQDAVQSEAAAGERSISGPVSAQDTVARQDTDMPGNGPDCQIGLGLRGNLWA